MPGVPESPVFDALGDGTRRQILAVLAGGEQSTGEIVSGLQARGRISQPAVSQHLKVLREAGLVTWRDEGNRRFYAIAPSGLEAAHAWLAWLADPLAALAPSLDALATEVARGKRARRAEERRSGSQSA